MDQGSMFWPHPEKLTKRNRQLKNQLITAKIKLRSSWQIKSQHETTEEEPDFSSDGCYEPDNETDTASESEEDVDISGDRYMFFTSYHLELT